MPLTSEQRAAYGPDWPEVSREIREERSGGRCECEGECGWERHRRFIDGGGTHPRHVRCPAINRHPSPFTASLVVLTVAHLDRNGHEGTHDRARLKAMCQGCHLAYDRRKPDAGEPEA